MAYRRLWSKVFRLTGSAPSDPYLAPRDPRRPPERPNLEDLWDQWEWGFQDFAVVAEDVAAQESAAATFAVPAASGSPLPEPVAAPPPWLLGGLLDLLVGLGIDL